MHAPLTRAYAMRVLAANARATRRRSFGFLGSETLSVAGTEPGVEGCGPGAQREHSARDLLMVASGAVFTCSNAASKWLVATYPIGEVLFTRTLVSLLTMAPSSCRRPALRCSARARLRRARDARRLAVRLADDAADRLQHDAARRRDRDHVLLADLHDARLGLFPAREGRPGALGRAAGRLPRRAGHRQSRRGHVPDRRAVRARQRDPVRHRGGGRARHDGDRVDRDADHVPAHAADGLSTR